MISLTIDKNKINLEGKGSVKEVCTEELAAILALRNNISEHLSFSKEKTNAMIIVALHEEE